MQMSDAGARLQFSELCDELLDEVVGGDPAVCPVLAALAGNHGPVFINPQGDVYLDGEPQWDCPPYDIWG